MRVHPYETGGDKTGLYVGRNILKNIYNNGERIGNLMLFTPFISI